MQLNELLFDLKNLTASQAPLADATRNQPTTDFTSYLDAASRPAPATTATAAGSGQEGSATMSLQEEYEALLPDIGVDGFGPPVSSFDVGVELQRLARVELKVQAMEEAGEIDKALDAFIGIHGLKDRLSKAEKEELRGRFVELTKAVLLEEEWKNAYLGAMKRRIDVSVEGLREFLLGDEGKARMVDMGVETPYGDPDLMSFVRDSKWNDFNPPEFSVVAKADQMLIEARRERELNRG